MKINIPYNAKAFWSWEKYLSRNQDILLCAHNEESAKICYEQLKIQQRDIKVFHLPSYDTVPYDRLSPAGNIIFERAAALSLLSHTHSPKILVTHINNLLLKLPPKASFANSVISLNRGDKVEITNLIDQLINNGFVRVSSAVDNGELAARGEILDIVIFNQGYRIHFAWNEIETIKLYDINTQCSGQSIDNISICGAREYPLNPKNIEHFKKKFIAKFGVNHLKSPIYDSISNGMRYNGYEYLGPLFYPELDCLVDYLDNPLIIYDDLSLNTAQEYQNSFAHSYEMRINTNQIDKSSFYYCLPPELLIDDISKIQNISAKNNIYISSELEESNEFSDPVISNSLINLGAVSDKKLALKHLLQKYQDKKIIIFCSSNKVKHKVKDFLQQPDILNEIEFMSESTTGRINLILAPIENSIAVLDQLLIHEKDILGVQNVVPPLSSKRKLANILTELDNIAEGDFVVHKEHGIGRFDRIETVNIDGIAHDCIKIFYANNDILYLPVENINQLQKYGDDYAELDRLGHTEWQRRKAKLKNKIRDIAGKLLKVTAKRELMRVAEVRYDSTEYKKFCDAFPYSETNDQLAAIHDIETDLTSGKLMDRLICGDVGFGKTEVAMRASFLVASDLNEYKPQIAIISPTTILCKQHYENFCQRFAGTNFKIAQLSRLIKPSQASKIKADIEAGEVDIIIGTHALLAKNIKFANLRMVIIDEEQHFGVLQKEQLKQFKAGIHVLSLSATPIPRTLQMSMVGIKDLSIISTPPIDRLVVSTKIIPYDSVIIREALMQEKMRGGISFYVTPKIKDIEQIAQQLELIVPELRYKIAHGRMKPNEIDNIMSEFYEGKFDILLSTTIIESGIDVPIANTIIIQGVEKLGLSQIYQLRGRVGRRKARGYAYLVFSNKTKITKYSTRRLEILQNLNSLGAGFMIASHDMDLRGFGNLVGDEQAGHIKEVGAELYQNMLDQAINELRHNKEEQIEFTPKINLKVPVLIPEAYIADSSLRLAIYRRSGQLSGPQEIMSFKSEMEDRFGPIPDEFLNLLKIVEIRNNCAELKIESLDGAEGGFILKFNKNFDVNDNVMNFIRKYPRHAKIKPDNKLVYLKTLTPQNMIQEVIKLLKEFAGEV